MMHSLVSKKRGFLIYLVIIVAVWSSFASAADISGPPEDREEIPLLYNRLGQNIEMEAGHYAGYINYRENLRLRDFWRELDRLNLNRDEIIQMITLLERRMEGRTSGGGPYPVPSGIVHVTGPSRLSLFFSNWRSFYFFLSGGFFMIISSLIVFSYCSACRSYCPVCGQEVISFLHGKDRHYEDDSQRKAA